MRTIAVLVVTLLASSASCAECPLDELIGFTIVAKKTIVYYIEADQKKDDFEGCKYDRIIAFDDNTGVKCASYGYHYAHRPEAYIFSNGTSSMKMCVESELYDVGPIQ